MSALHLTAHALQDMLQHKAVRRDVDLFIKAEPLDMFITRLGFQVGEIDTA